MIAGIDYSMNCPAVCILDATAKHPDEAFFYSYHKKGPHSVGPFYLSPPPAWTHEQERYNLNALYVIDKLKKHNVKQVFIEGYAYASNASSIFPLAENKSVLKLRLWEAGIPFEVIPPTSIKKFASGKGNANKDAMYEAWFQQTGLDLLSLFSLGKKPDKKIGSPHTDIVDAWFIARMGAETSTKS